MTSPPTATPRQWVIATDYPRWPSPYFAHLHRYAPQTLPLTFCPDLASVSAIQPPGVLNLHRLKRLYHDASQGTRTPRAAAEFLARLADMRQAGWRVVWTVHNLKPIDGDAATGTDDIVTRGVLDLADIVLCHTNADSTVLRSRTDADVRVIGWAGLDNPTRPPGGAVSELMDHMRGQPLAFLLLGHITRYKDVPAAAATFLARTTRASLVIVGASRDPAISAALSRVVAGADGRVIWYPHRVPPELAGHLYAAADAAVCPYRTDGDYGFLSEVLHPSSVATATCYQVPVIAPDLPAVEEITRGRPRWLAPAEGGLGPAMAAAESTLTTLRHAVAPKARRPPSDSAHRWKRIGRIYQSLAAELLPVEPSTRAASGSPSHQDPTGEPRR
ncbi:glycosyltransferase [Solwaraspora sp. WMMD406]|uniref:glycosyltransferase n=1 Tax=Solwaraspora sp. WMMD406 TaxID=3016095 RepID=UPI002417DD49|nr:glycosyltransferase [Solwaraspora sp. WMMD406]MDG4763320.1 glycosyltransferase [Solwaraspora sp. WMMD406]